MDPPSLDSLSLESEPLTSMRLPTELLESIADKLPQKDRLALATVNKGLRDIAQRSIFETIELTWGTKAALTTIENLLRCIRDNPPLANLVRTLTISSPDDLTYGYENSWIDNKTLGADTINNMVKKLGFDNDHQNWVDDMTSGRIRSNLPVLIAQFSRLEKLDLSGIIAEKQRLLGTAMAQSHVVPIETGQDRFAFPFASIKSAVFHMDMTDEILDNVITLQFTAMGFFFLPCLEKLAVHIPQDTPASWPFDETATPTSLKELQVDAYHQGGAEVVELILKATPALWYFRYVNIWRFDDPSGLDLTDLSSLLAKATGPIYALALHANRVPPSPQTRTRLMFGVVVMVTGASSLAEIRNPETFVTGELSLASMVHVEQLLLTWIHIFGLAPGTNLPLGPSTFPPKMTRLTIHGTMLMAGEHNFWNLFDRVRAARDFVSVCRTYAPHLVEIEFDDGAFFHHPFEDRIKRDLQYAGEPHGVEVTFTSHAFMQTRRGHLEKIPHDSQWLVSDETAEDDGASQISLD